MSAVDGIFTQSLASMNQAAPEVRLGGSPDETRETAEEFEQFFVAQMLEHMFSGIPTDGPFSGGHAENIFRSLLNTEYAKVIRETGGIGLADAVQREIVLLQGKENS
jgi:peptidoglycan hydrolase FlgJ